MTKRKTAHVSYEVNLISCVGDIEEFRKELRKYLIDKFKPDFKSDVKVDILTHSVIRK